MVRRLYVLIGFCMVFLIAAYYIMYQHPPDRSRTVVSISTNLNSFKDSSEPYMDAFTTKKSESNFSTSQAILIQKDDQLIKTERNSFTTVSGLKKTKSTQSAALIRTTFEATQSFMSSKKFVAAKLITITSEALPSLSEEKNKTATFNLTKSKPVLTDKGSSSSQTETPHGLDKTLQVVTLSQVPQTEKHIPLILLYHKLHEKPNWWFTKTDEDFRSCPHMCQITNNKSNFAIADMVVFEAPRYIKMIENDTIFLEYFRDWGDWPGKRGNDNQVRLFFAREPQTAGLSGEGLAFAKHMFNYSVTFLNESDLFYPYGHVSKIAAEENSYTDEDLASGKSKMILWIVSNCYSQRRMRYKEELNKYIQVDMLGACNKTHGDPCKRDYRCVRDMKMQYKFYLAFENTQCKEYITEKFWKSLTDYMVPVVMGAPRQDYERVAPPHSFIHVDDFKDPRELANYLLLLDKNNALYNEYHHWRRKYRIEWDSANCEICRLAHEKPAQILDITKLWDATSQCTNSSGLTVL